MHVSKHVFSVQSGEADAEPKQKSNQKLRIPRSTDLLPQLYLSATDSAAAESDPGSTSFTLRPK